MDDGSTGKSPKRSFPAPASDPGRERACPPSHEPPRHPAKRRPIVPGGRAHGAFAGNRMSDAQLRALLLDCLVLWDVEGKVTVRDHDLAVETQTGTFSVTRADADLHPVRWFLQTPDRDAARRPPRAIPSIVALLSALRNAVEGAGGDRLRIGGG